MGGFPISSPVWVRNHTQDPRRNRGCSCREKAFQKLRQRIQVFGFRSRPHNGFTLSPRGSGVEMDSSKVCFVPNVPTPEQQRPSFALLFNKIFGRYQKESEAWGSLGDRTWRLLPVAADRHSSRRENKPCLFLPLTARMELAEEKARTTHWP